MIEIMVGAYIGAFALSTLTIFLTLLKVRRQFQSVSFLKLTKNLAGAGLYWSIAKSDFIPLKETSLENDKSKAASSILKIMAVFAFFSVPGLLLNLLVSISMFYLARPRLEKAVFSSLLAHEENLPAAEVQNLVAELKSQNN